MNIIKAVAIYFALGLVYTTALGRTMELAVNNLEEKDLGYKLQTLIHVYYVCVWPLFLMADMVWPEDRKI